MGTGCEEEDRIEPDVTYEVLSVHDLKSSMSNCRVCEGCIQSVVLGAGLWSALLGTRHAGFGERYIGQRPLLRMIHLVEHKTRRYSLGLEWRLNTLLRKCKLG